MRTDDPGASAIELIESEHRALGAVVHALRGFSHALRDRRAGADFELLATMLYYIDVFPERFHHPKEDLHLFSALRRRTAALDEVLDALQAEHVRSGQLMSQLEKAFLHYQGGAPGGSRTSARTWTLTPRSCLITCALKRNGSLRRHRIT